MPLSLLLLLRPLVRDADVFEVRKSVERREQSNQDGRNRFCENAKRKQCATKGKWSNSSLENTEWIISVREVNYLVRAR